MEKHDRADVTVLLIIVLILGAMIGFRVGRLQIWGIGGVNANNNARQAMGNVIVGIGNNITLKP
ncbi:MAG: hypothetical protein K8L97_03895 [Anaerolineae bacterium]|nr:hypothetical protein [Anaerolineae bacterium]